MPPLPSYCLLAWLASMESRLSGQENLSTIRSLKRLALWKTIQGEHKFHKSRVDRMGVLVKGECANLATLQGARQPLAIGPRQVGDGYAQEIAADQPVAAGPSERGEGNAVSDGQSLDLSAAIG